MRLCPLQFDQCDAKTGSLIDSHLSNFRNFKSIQHLRGFRGQHRQKDCYPAKMDKTAFAASFGAPISQTNKGQLPDRRHAFLCMSQTSDARPTNDGLFGRIAIAIFRRVMKPHVGKPSPRIGYDGLVDDCRILLSRKSPREQRQIVLNVLSTLFVSPRGPRLFRERFADKPEINARITPLFFQWLVGPAAVNDPPAETGGRPGAGVFIEKCRFLDESGCKGLCLNMCQQVSLLSSK